VIGVLLQPMVLALHTVLVLLPMYLQAYMVHNPEPDRPQTRCRTVLISGALPYPMQPVLQHSTRANGCVVVVQLAARASMFSTAVHDITSMHANAPAVCLGQISLNPTVDKH